MKKMKRLLGLFLSLALVLGLFPGMSLTAYAADTTITWDSSVINIISLKTVNASYNNSGITVQMTALEKTGGFYYTNMQSTGTATFVFSSTVGNIKGITINAETASLSYDGWTRDSTTVTWSGTPASSVTLSGSPISIRGISSIVFTIEGANVDVAGVTLNKTETTLTVGGDPVTLTATVDPNNATDKTVKWSASNANVTLYSNEACTTEVGTDATETLTVYAKGISAGSATVTATSNADSTKSASCDVTVNAATHNVTITAGSNMTKTAGSGAESQTDLSDAMTPVVYTANDGYYFPTDYSVAAVNGISVTRDSYTQITVSGTPTADASITLAVPTAKTTPAAPTTAAAVDCTTSDNNDGKLTGVTTAMEYKKSDAESWTVGTGSDITGLVPGRYYVRVKATDTTNASAYQELTIAEYTAPIYTVTYKVVNGTWSDDSTADKTENVQSGSTPASVPTGMKAASGYTGGAWDTDPTGTTINGATTFTYTFTAKQASTVTKAPTAKNLTYTGSAQELVTAGTASGGEMQYALGTATEATKPYTTSIPTATDAGTYYVWYKAVGSGNYKDSVPVCITVSIKEEDDSQNKGATDEKVEQHADTPETTVSGVSDELTNEVATPAEKTAVESGAKATFTFELTNADSTVPAAEKQSLENVVRTEAPNAVIGMLLDLKAFFQVGNMPKRQLDTLNGKTVTFNFKVPEKLHAPAGIRRTFFILQNHEGKISILARTTATNIPFSAGDFSTYALAYSDENTDKEGFNTSIKIKQSEGKIKVSWDKVNGVAKVKVYATYCGKDYPSKPVKTTKGNSVTIKKLNGKKLNLKKNFKLYLVAYDKDGNKIGKTPSAHFAGKNSDKYTNPKSIKVSNKNVSVAVGANVKVKATIKLEDKKRKELPKKHAEKFRYRSTKNYIATVDKKGNIKGIAPGTCTVYVYAKNGLAKKVTVTVN